MRLLDVLSAAWYAVYEKKRRDGKGIMKLYKISSMVGDHGVSVFPKQGSTMPPPDELMAEPITDLIRQIQVKGYTEHEAYLAVQAWAYHASNDLRQGARGVRIFCEMCAREISSKPVPPEPISWGVIIMAAVIVALALGLYLWAVLDRDLNVRYRGHEWAYVMRYKERLWQAEITAVSDKQVGYYDRGGDFGGVIAYDSRNIQRVSGRDYIAFWPRRMVLAGRRLIFYHIYDFKGFYVQFLGYMFDTGLGLYRLKKGYSDPYKPEGFWRRPGGPWGTPEYEGCWKQWWWL